MQACWNEDMLLDLYQGKRGKISQSACSMMDLHVYIMYFI